MADGKAGRPSLSDDGKPSEVINFRLTKEQLKQLKRLYALEDSANSGIWVNKKISFSEMLRRVLLQTPIPIRVSHLQSEIRYYHHELRVFEKTLSRRKQPADNAELLAALEPVIQKIRELEDQVKSLHLSPISALDE